MTEQPIEVATVDAATNLRTRVLRELPSYVQTYLGRFGTWLNADNASELFPEYSASPEARQRLFLVVRPAAGAVVEGAYERLLVEPIASGRQPFIVFTGGGNGAGKSTSVRNDGAIVFDSTLSLLEPSVRKIDAALKAGFYVRVRYLYREPIEAWAEGVLPRAMSPDSPEPGRPVRLTGHVQTHLGAHATALSLHQHFHRDPRVKVRIFENRTGHPLALRSVEWLTSKEYPASDVIKERLRAVLDEQLADGRISQSLYDSARGVGSDAGRIGSRRS